MLYYKLKIRRALHGPEVLAISALRARRADSRRHGACERCTDMFNALHALRHTAVVQVVPQSVAETLRVHASVQSSESPAVIEYCMVLALANEA